MLTAATALAIGQRPDTLLRATALSVAFARRLGWVGAELETVYWYSLLRYAGCHAENHMFSALIGDEIAFNRAFAVIDNGNPAELLALVATAVGRAHADLGPAGAEALLAASLPSLGASSIEMMAGHCEVAQRLAIRLGFDAATVSALGQFRERWDGGGQPHRLVGEALERPVRLVFLCQDAMILSVALGRDAMLETLRSRSGSAYDPALAGAFLAQIGELEPVMGAADAWAAAMAGEPGTPRLLTDAEFDDACLMFADFCDLQLPHAVSHSRAVAGLAQAAAATLGMPAKEQAELRQAALLHDLGYAAVPVRARGGHADRLHAEGDARLHPFHGEDLLARAGALRPLAALVGRHHEACDGSGYFRGLNGAALTAGAKILAAAEAYRTLFEGRFGGAALSPAEAGAALRAEITAGRIDADAGKAVLAAAGHQVSVKKRDLPAGLTNRELDILRLAAQGQSMKEIGARLGISPKTVDNHLQNLYPKIEVRTRSGATLFAIEHGLCSVPK